MSRTVTEWVLKLVDDITAPMRSVHEACSGASSAAEETAESINGIHETVSRMPGSAEKIGAAAFMFNQVTDAVGRANAEIKNLTGGQLSFETVMAKANTMAELGAGELSGMTKEIRAMSEEMPILRDNLADGFYQVVSNSVPEDNWISFLQDSAKASVGGVADLGQAVKVTSTVIKNYGLAWNQAGLIQDKIQKTAKLGVTSFAEMGEALPKVAGQAQILGLNIDELFGSFAALTGVSGNTSEIATQLKAVFTALIKPTSEAGQIAEKIGIQFDSASIKAAGGMQAFFKQLKTKVETYSASTGELSTELYGRLFGSSEALSAFLFLTGQVADDWDTKSNEIANAAGTIERAVDIMSDTAAAKMEMLQNRVSNFKESIVEAISGCLPFVTVMGDAVTSASSLGFAIYGLSIVFKKELWTGLWSGIRSMATFSKTCATGAVSAVKFALTGGLSFTAFRVSAVSACRGVSTAISNIPILGWIAALIALVVAACVKFDDWGKYVLAFMGPVGWLATAFITLKRNWQSIVDAFQGGGFLEGCKRIGIVLLDFVLKPLQSILELIAKIPVVGKYAVSGVESIKELRKGFDLTGQEDKKAENTTNPEFQFVEPPAVADGMVIDTATVKPGSIAVTGAENKAVNLAGDGGGSGGGGRNVTMNVTFNQTFRVDGNGGNIDGIAEQVMRVITGTMRDATVALS